MSHRSCLILGSTGRFGRSCKEAFEAAGWDVHCFDRATQSLDVQARNKDVIVKGWHAPYHHWDRDVLRFTKEVCEVAQRYGSTVIVPGNVYNYGVSEQAEWGVDTPWVAKSKLGQIRIEMERMYQSAGIKTIVVRSGDYNDTRASGTWLDLVIAKPVVKGYISYPAKGTVKHAWAFLPDVGRLSVELAEKREQLDPFTEVLFPGFNLTGNELAEVISSALGRPIEFRKMSWMPFYVSAPFWPLGRYILSMRYLWDHPHALSSASLEQHFPNFKGTSATDVFKQVLPYAG